LRALVDRAPTPDRWFIVDAGAITDIDYSAAQSMRDLLDDLARQRVGMSSQVSVGTFGPTWTDITSQRRSARRGFSRHSTKPPPRCARRRALGHTRAMRGTRLRPQRRRHCSAVRSSCAFSDFAGYRGPQCGLVRPSYCKMLCDNADEGFTRPFRQLMLLGQGRSKMLERNGTAGLLERLVSCFT
jgi:hypothetical protein